MEKISKMIKDEREISYEGLKQIQEHARLYESTFDKKEFLKNVGAYEQKFILLNSKDPYEVLCYLEQLDLPATKQILNELTYDEVSRLLALFTSEDKKRFYTTFSELSLVNQFIAYDKKSSQYIEDLSIDRKIDLLNSSDSDTVLASSKVYESISSEDKSKVMDSIKSGDALSTLSNSSSYSYDSVNDNNSADDNLIVESEAQVQIEELDDNTNDQSEKMQENEETEEKIENELKVDLLSQEKMDYLKNNFENYKTMYPEINELDINNPQILTMLSEAVLAALNNDFIKFKKQNTLNNNILQTELEQTNLVDSDALDKFVQTREQCETELIHNLQEQLDVSQTIDLTTEEDVLSSQKSL